MAYIRNLDFVCTRFVDTLLNDDTSKQFFIQGFIKSSTIRGVLEKNPCTLADAKVAAREKGQIDRNYEWSWRRKDELILQFICLQHREIEVEPVRPLIQAPHSSIGSGPRPLVVKEPVPLLALPAHRVDPPLEEMEIRLDVTQLGFQEAMSKQMQSFTDHMSLTIRNHQLSLSPQVDSGKHVSRFWCVQCQQPGHTRQFCKNGQNCNQRLNGNPPPQKPKRSR